MPEFVIVILIGLGALLPFFFLSATAFDRLVRRLHKDHLDEWRRSGGPVGFFWRPAEGILATSLPAFMMAGFGWPFRMPSVLKDDPSAKRDQIILRLCLVIWNVGVISLFAFLLRRYGFPPRV